jgi:hypothetical protein
MGSTKSLGPPSSLKDEDGSKSKALPAPSAPKRRSRFAPAAPSSLRSTDSSPSYTLAGSPPDGGQT